MSPGDRDDPVVLTGTDGIRLRVAAELSREVEARLASMALEIAGILARGMREGLIEEIVP